MMNEDNNYIDIRYIINFAEGMLKSEPFSRQSLWVDIIQLLKEKQERDKMRCENCEYLTMLDRNADLNGMFWHCSIWRGDETKNVWHKYSKHYKDYSLVEYNDFCSYFEPKEGETNNE